MTFVAKLRKEMDFGVLVGFCSRSLLFFLFLFAFLLLVLKTNLERVARLRVADFDRSGLGLCNSGLELSAPGLGLAP